jgi:hypothetical protein
MKNSITKAIKELEKLYVVINRELFNNKLDQNIRITIQTKGRAKKIIGYHSPKRWKKEDGEMITEITICAEDLNSCDPAEVLIHEACHNYNFMRDIKDCCTNQYHNKKFKTVAEMAGLKVTRSRTYGWCFTDLGEKAQKVVNESGFNYEVFKSFRLTASPAPTYLRKFMCECGMIIRVARVDDFSATCNNCLTDFKIAD